MPSAAQTSHPDPSDHTVAATPSTLSACVELTKPGITRLVTITALVGLLISGLHHHVTGLSNWIILILGCATGTALASGGANALNMWYESDLDARMDRTKSRPIPSTRLTPRFVLLFGLTLCATGAAVLALTLSQLSAIVALVTAALYVVIYTPLKTRTITNTLVGAVPGALPTLIGTCALSQATGFAKLADPIGLMLFTLMFVWQLPHFFAIAWMCRRDYERGGFRMLPAIDASGNHTAAIMIFTSLLLIPVTLAPLRIVPDLAGIPTALAAVILGLLMVALSIKFAVARTDRAARTVFFGSIIHLPLYMLVFVADALARALL